MTREEMRALRKRQHEAKKVRKQEMKVLHDAHKEDWRRDVKQIPTLSPANRSAMIRMEYLRTREPDVYNRVMAVEGPRIAMEANAVDTEDTSGLNGLAGFSLSKAIKKVKKVAINPALILNKKAASSTAKSKTAKKATKLASKFNPAVIINKAIVPKKAQAKSKKFEQTHRKEIKIAGAVAAVALGAYTLAPEMVGGYLTTGLTEGKVLAIGLAKKLGFDSAKDATKEALWEKGKTKLTEEASDKMAEFIERVGKDKFREIMAKYADDSGNPPTSPDDPRMEQMQAELIAAAQGISPAVAQASVIQENKASSAGEKIKAAAPYIGIGAALLSLFS